MEYLKLKYKEIDIQLELQDKYYVIDGYSGAGKSKAVKLIDLDGFRKGIVESSLPVKVVHSVAEINDIQDDRVIYVTDEVFAGRVLEKVKGMQCYCILISRKIYSGTNLSYRSYCEAFRDGACTRVRQKYKFNQTAINKVEFDMVLVEDSGLGFTFFEKCFDNYLVMSSYGKGNIAKLLNQYRDRDILVICDLGGIGNHLASMYKIVRKRKGSGKKTTFMLIESFEHLLMQTKYIGYDYDIFKYFDNKFDNTEHFTQVELERITQHTEIEYRHGGRSSKCWVDNCDTCENQNCSYRIVGEKTKQLLASTRFFELVDAEGGSGST